MSANQGTIQGRFAWRNIDLRYVAGRREGSETNDCASSGEHHERFFEQGSRDTHFRLLAIGEKVQQANSRRGFGREISPSVPEELQHRGRGRHHQRGASVKALLESIFKRKTKLCQIAQQIRERARVTIERIRVNRNSAVQNCLSTDLVNNKRIKVQIRVHLLNTKR